MIHKTDQPDVVLHFLDADRLAGKDLAEVNLFATEADAAAMRNDNRSVVEWVVDVRQSLIRTRRSSQNAAPLGMKRKTCLRHYLENGKP